MRAGHTFKRCRRCGRKVTDRRCQCGSDSIAWAFTVDIAGTGEARKQIMRSGFPTKGAARDAMTELQVQKQKGTYVKPDQQTVGQYLVEWLAGAKVRPSTRSGYEVCIRRHIVPRLGALRLQQLTARRVAQFVQELDAAPLGRGAGTLSPKSVHNVLICLRAALATAVKHDLISRNPAERASSAPRARAMSPWSADELRAFLAATVADREFALWRLMASTGLRRGEALGLRWCDVDFTTGGLAVQQQLVRAGAEVAFGPLKTDKSHRSITIDRGTVAALRAHRARQLEDERLLLGQAYQDHDLVFCRPDGHPHDPDVITHRFESLSRRAGLRVIRLHDLRHTAATLLLKAGVHPKVVSERLGHSSVMITLDRYSHVTPDLQEDAAAKIGAVVDGP